MQEYTNREEPLSEELLEAVTGAGGEGSFLNCPSCHVHAVHYDFHIYMRDDIQQSIDSKVRVGNYYAADLNFKDSENHHRAAQDIYEEMAAHGHPDFPAALSHQRQNYNPGH
jgi:hypothetical protein